MGFRKRGVEASSGNASLQTGGLHGAVYLVADTKHSVHYGGLEHGRELHRECWEEDWERRRLTWPWPWGRRSQFGDVPTDVLGLGIGLTGMPPRLSHRTLPLDRLDRGDG